MRISKRDFLKSLGIGAAVTPALAHSYKQTMDATLGKPPYLSEPALADAPEPHAIPVSHLPQFLDMQDSILYDRVTFRPGSLLPPFIAMFTHGVGHLCPHMGIVKLHAHTNMYIPQQLPAPSSFWIRRIHIAVNPDIAPADAKTAREFSWEFMIGQKIFARGPFALDMQRRTLTELLKGKTPATRASLQFDTTKGLYMPMQCSFYASIATASYRQALANRSFFDHETFPSRVSADGNGIEFMMTLEGVEWRGIS
jgi:hypothetical protein